eukprot:scaffold52150_cov50-Cyclotella_meneghiniana.AAC.1
MTFHIPGDSALPLSYRGLILKVQPHLIEGHLKLAYRKDISKVGSSAVGNGEFQLINWDPSPFVIGDTIKGGFA